MKGNVDYSLILHLHKVFRYLAEEMVAGVAAVDAVVPVGVG
jgi:hypothetical protein